MIKLALVDDHPIVREGLVAILEDEPDFKVVASVGSAEELLRDARRLRPDVVVLDLELPALDGVAAIGRIAEVSPDTKVIVFTAYAAGERVVGALKAGAKGYLVKGAPAQEIVQAVRQVQAGGSHIAADIATKIFKDAERGTSTALSERELQILALIGKGNSNKQIGRALAISERTVKFHVTSILNKLGADNRAQATAIATQRGLI